MGRSLLVLVKTLLTCVVAGAVVIASFYSAYLLMLLFVLGSVGILAYWFYRRQDSISWFDYEDSE